MLMMITLQDCSCKSYIFFCLNHRVEQTRYMSKWVKYFGRKGLNFFNFFTVTYRRVLTPQSRALHEDILFFQYFSTGCAELFVLGLPI